ncbi:hypothetical protein AAFF_G00411130 [Aldrovandia affinis]|uniref:PiggyBac transposable element-derived protein domain-containing protein n=1 Tax=Aldrovandia affinis TaxID=143900 RepID=A0AAD7WJJ8_9TELE|nr:hypothetical protein AAFF_G00411130 [Aldrovandia affinis]
MSRNRFREIMCFLHFDRRESRRCRLTTDKFALMTEVCERFVHNSIACYKPGPDITMDEQLFPAKAQCCFTQYMPNKSDKFGNKFWLAPDVKTMVNGFPYLGKDDSRPTTQRLGENMVLKLVESYMGKGRNITTDHFFTSLPLANKLLYKNNSLVGTVNRNKRELPPSVQGRAELFSTKVLKNERATLAVYQCKPRRNVSILSTQHQHVAITRRQEEA